ncbi:MAG: cytochrome c oxidase subunit 3 [Pirellulales bacterium]
MSDFSLVDHGEHEHVDPYESPEHRREAVVFGMWVFLATEILFFGGLFTVYSVYRYEFHAAFSAASNHLDLVLGTFNTFLLLTSSLTMALAVQAGDQGNAKLAKLMLLATIALGAGFLGVKSIEYAHKYHDGLLPVLGRPFHWEDATLVRGVQLFMSLYIGMTGLHALHMIIGIGLLGWLLAMCREKAWAERGEAFNIVGLYWHFVDLAWIFLFPLLYLVDRFG